MSDVITPKWQIKLKPDLPKLQIKLKPDVMKECSNCSNCSSNKLKTEFYAGHGQCKDCIKEKQRERNKDDKEKDKIRKSDPENWTKTRNCYNCGKDQPLLTFRIGRATCNDCERLYGRSYYTENKHVRQKWALENKERHRLLKANWHQENRVHLQAKYNARYHQDPEFKLKILQKSRLWNTIQKIKRTEEYVGGFSLLKDWLEHCFDDQMTWENHGDYWEIDHVIPISRFDLSDDQQIAICFNWKNLTPLKKTANMEKSNRIDFSQIYSHLDTLTDFLAINEMEYPEEYFENYNIYLTIISETP
jgi:hypothetical protein